MNFSKKYKNSLSPSFSKCGKMIATTIGSKIWSLSDPVWRCSMDESDAGIQSVFWSPDSLHLLILHDFALFITVWSLEYGTQMYIKNTKSPQTVQFSPDGKYLAVIERTECNDFVDIFHTTSWTLLSQFKLPTVNAAGILWANSNAEVLVWDHSFEHRFYWYYTEGTQRFSHEIKKPISMGLQCVSVSPDGNTIVLGHHLHTIYLVNTLIRKVYGELVIPEIVSGKEVHVYREAFTNLVGSTILEQLNATPEHKFEVVTDDTVDISFDEITVEKTKATNAKEKPPKKYGISSMKWSQDSSYLAVLDSSRSNVITIWETKLRVLTAVLILRSSVKSFAWHPHLLRLIIGSGENSLYMWELDGSWVIQLPMECAVHVNKITWSSQGDSLLLGSKDSHCVGFLDGAQVGDD